MFSVHVHCFVMQESRVIKILWLTYIKVNFNFSLLEVLVSIRILVFTSSLKSSKDVLCVKIVKTPNNKNWTAWSKTPNNDSLPDPIKIVIFLQYVRKEKCLSPKYENTNTTRECVKRHSRFQQVHVVFLSMPPWA